MLNLPYSITAQYTTAHSALQSLVVLSTCDGGETEGAKLAELRKSTIDKAPGCHIWRSRSGIWFLEMVV